MSHDFNQSRGPKIILIACVDCLKVRDDRGYWYDRNEYRKDYQGVLFGYTRCHECASKHYAEFYEGVQQEATT